MRLMDRLQRWLSRIWSAEAWPFIPIFVVAGLILIFGFIADEVTEGATLAFDNYLLSAFRSSANNFSSPIGPVWVQEMARDITSLGSFTVLGLLLSAVIGYLLLSRKSTSALLVLVAVLGGVALNSLLKFEFARSRPDLFIPAARVFTASFPSGHAALSAITYMTLAALLSRTIQSRLLRHYFVGVAVTLTFLIGLSRVYLGVHYPTDVLAGWTIGSAWALGSWTIMTRLQSQGVVERPESSN